MSNVETEARVAVRIGPLIVEMSEALGWAIAFGLCAISYYALRGLFSFTVDPVAGLIGHIPGVGGWVKGKIDAAEQRLTHWVGQAAIASEARMGDAFHAAGNLAASIGHEIEGQAIATWHIAQWVYKVAASVVSGEAWQEIFHNTIRSQDAKIRAVRRDVSRQGKAIAHAKDAPIGAQARVRSGALSASVAGALEGELPRLRARTRAHEDAHQHEAAVDRARAGGIAATIGGLLDRIGAAGRTVGATAAVGVVAIALQRFGLNWLRCSNWRRIGRAGCRMPLHFLEDLLALGADFLVLTNICRVIPWLERGFADVAAPLVDVLARAGAGVCGPGTSHPATLATPALYLPARADATLHLP